MTLAVGFILGQLIANSG